MVGASLIQICDAIRRLGGGIGNSLLQAHNWLSAVGFGGSPSLLNCRDRVNALIAAMSGGPVGK